MGIQGTRPDRGALMIRRITSLVMVLFAILLLALWLLSPPGRLPARFSTSDCQTVALTGPDGEALAGIEDIALIPDGGQLILSAHNRARLDTNGGLYTVTPFALGAGGDISVRRLSRPREPGAVFRPHGITLTPDGNRLAVINRVAPDRSTIEIGPLGPDGWSPEETLTGEILCRANDLIFAGYGKDALLVTLDRADCVTSLRDLWPEARTGRLAAYDGDRLSITRGQLAFPNGLAGPYIAETRGKRLARPGDAALDLPGGPDNLNFDGERHLIAALHPKLLHVWLYLEGWQDRAPSRIVRIDPVAGSHEVLFDDPGGTLFSAATSAVMAGGMLIAGSVRDDGLLVCQRGGL